VDHDDRNHDENNQVDDVGESSGVFCDDILEVQGVTIRIEGMTMEWGNNNEESREGNEGTRVKNQYSSENTPWRRLNKIPKLTTESPFSMSKQMMIGTDESETRNLHQLSFKAIKSSLTNSENDRRIRRISFVSSRQNYEPLHRVDSKSVFDEVLEKQTEAAHGQK
jgi:hypothetical protein